jgi:hypothetical protein
MESHFIPRTGTVLTPRPESIPLTAPRAVPSDEPTRERYRGRDFGIGYGNSSGYGSPRRYVSGIAIAPFRVR